ncbi:MAG: DUF3822 family protein [Bacteroidetes bacterium]|nr:MAG: DUF3822 family protein [Bacteroidota bacterium]
MYNNPFDTHTYIAPVPHAHAQREVSLFVKDSGVVLFVQDESGTIIDCRKFYNKDQLALEIFLRLLFEKEPGLKSASHSCRVLTGQSVFALAPADYLPARRMLDFARLVLEEAIFEEELVQYPIPELKAQLLFSVPYSIRHIIQSYLPQARLGHIAEVLIPLSLELCPQRGIVMLIYDQQVLIAARAGGQLQLINRFQFMAHADILYFLQSVRKVTHLEDKEVPVYVMGDLEGKMKTLKQYMDHIQVPQNLSQQLPGSKLEVPYWEFAFLAWRPESVLDMTTGKAQGK